MDDGFTVGVHRGRPLEEPQRRQGRVVGFALWQVVDVPHHVPSLSSLPLSLCSLSLSLRCSLWSCAMRAALIRELQLIYTADCLYSNSFLER